MSGRPVWLASVSYRRRKQIVPTAQWNRTTQEQAMKVARRVFGPFGDPSMERAFLMCATLCYHRGMTDREIAQLPPGPGWLAGPPFDKILYETDGAPPAALSFQPCENRRYQELNTDQVVGKNLSMAQSGISGRKATLKLPIDDCGECPSCLERESTLARIAAYQADQ